MLGLRSREIVSVVALFLIWRSILFGISINADNFLPYKPTFPYANEILATSAMPRWLYSWGNFDGVHYLTIAEHGYKGYGLIQAFFPIYPLLIAMSSPITSNLLVTGLLISNLSFVMVLLLFFALTKELYNGDIAWRSLLLFLVFPTSFFAGALYNESLFLMFVLAAFYAAYKKQWLVAGILAGFASATRVVGIFLVIGLIAGLFFSMLEKQRKSSKKSMSVQLVESTQMLLREQSKVVLALSAGFVGLLSYMLYLWISFDDPFYFLHVQSEFGAGREEHIILLPQTIWRAIKIVLTVPLDLRYLGYLQELVYTCLFLGVLLFSFKRRYSIPYAWLVFSVLAILLPTATGTLTSMPRYVFVAFPFFVILALVEWPKYVWYGIYLVSAALLIFNTVLFIQGYWVA